MDNEIVFRLIFFIIILMIMMFLEIIFPQRKLSLTRKVRWFRNFSLIIINNILIKLVVPITTIGIAIYVQKNNIGILNNLEFNSTLEIIIAIVCLDLIIYTQHFLFHYMPWLWKLHKVHHIDQDIDVSTGLRFHPVEILISLGIKNIAVIILGVPAIAVIIFEIVLNATAMFNHSNIRLSQKLDKYLRFFIVTPDMHRIHHSVIQSETDSNFGFNIPLWDRIFGTYKVHPKLGHLKMMIGLSEYQDPTKTGLKELLLIPFKKNKI